MSAAPDPIAPESIYTPSPWGRLFHSLPHNEALGAGAAGPGKTLVLLMDPLPQIVCEHSRAFDKNNPNPIIPGHSVGWALHVRRTMPMLEQTIVRAHRIFPRIDPGVKWDGTKHTFLFSSGYRFQFGHCRDSGDWQQYMSSEFTHFAPDELVQLEEEQYDQIGGRVRTSDPVLSKMLKIRAMSNPLIDREGMDNIRTQDPFWVRNRFVKPNPQGGETLKREITLASGKKKMWTSIYLPATLYDNPDPVFVEQYETLLRTRPKHIQKALLFGDWFFTAGSYFVDWDPMVHTTEQFRVPLDWAWFRSMDWGFRVPGCVHWWAIDPDGVLWCVREMTFVGKTATEVAKLVRQVEQDLGLWDKLRDRSRITGPADTQIWGNSGTTGKTLIEEFEAQGIGWMQADKRSRARNAQLLAGRLRDHRNKTATPGIVFFKSCREVIQIIPGVVAGQGADAETPVDFTDDHWLDSALYACAFASRGRSGVPSPTRVMKSEELDAPAPPRGQYGYGGY